MKAYRKMSRAALLEWVGRLQARLAAQRQTGRQRAAAARRAGEARLRAILETAVEGIVTISEQGIIESFNLAAEKIFGYAAAEVTGKNVTVLMPAPHHALHDGYLAHYRDTGRAEIIGIGREVTGRRKSGEIFPMDLSVSEVRLADRRDITERKRLEQEILEISEREQRRIGHDLHDGLGQQLAGIELMSQVLAQKLERRSKAEAARAGEIARHVRETIAQTRALARGLSPVTLEAEGLMAALGELAANTEQLFRVTCTFQCDPPVPVRDQVAAAHLFRIAQEAVSNAIRHGQKVRHIMLELKDTGGKITLSVSDDGVGFQPRDPAAKSQGGQSMGLRIMQSRAGMIGGHLAIERNANGGATVAILLPHSATPAPNPHAPQI